MHSPRCCVKDCNYLGPRTHYKRLIHMSQTVINRLKAEHLLKPDCSHMCEKHIKSLVPDGTVKCDDCCCVPGYMFNVPERDAYPETFGDLAKLPDHHDFIMDLFYLKQNVNSRMKLLVKDWCVSETLNSIMFFLLEPADIPTIYVSIKLDLFLKATVSLDGRLMDPRDLTPFIPITGKVTRWSQLETILVYYSKKQAKASRNFVPVVFREETE